jgi:hypothetical protein
MSLPCFVGRWTRSNNRLLQIQRGFLRCAGIRAAWELLKTSMVLVLTPIRWRLLLLLRRRLRLMPRTSVLWGHRSRTSGGRPELLPTLAALVASRFLFRSIARFVLLLFRWA